MTRRSSILDGSNEPAKPTTTATELNVNPTTMEANVDQLPAAIRQSENRVVALPQNIISEERIAAIGNVDSKVIGTVTTRLLSVQRAGDSDGMTDKLNSLISEAKNLSPDNFKKGFLGGLFNKVANKKEELFAKFDTVNGRILVLAGELDKEKQVQLTRKKDIEDLIVANEAYARSLNEAYKEGEECLVVLNQEIENFGQATTSEEAQVLSVLEERRNLLEKTVADIQGFRLLSVQMAPKLNDMKATATSLMSTFDTIIGKVIPAYALVFSQYIISMDQKRGIQLQDTTINAFNEAISSGSNLAKANSEDNAKMRQRQLVDIETLKLDHDNMLQGIENVKRINAESHAKRLAYKDDIKAMEQKLIAVYNS